MIQHYKDLIKLYWLRIVAGAVIAGALALALSLVLLKAAPSYEAEVTFNMQPSEEALSFNRQFLGQSQFNPATIITETHIERLLSRPIAERTLDKLLQENGSASPLEPTLLSKAKLWLWKTWTRLNYGEYRPLPEREQILNDLLKSLDVEPVEGSYILKMTAAYKFPAIATAIANTHAESYLEAASEEFEAQLANRASVIQSRIDNEELQLARLFEERERLRNDFDIANLSSESELLINSLQTLREELEDDELQRRLRLNEIAVLEGEQNTARSRGEVADLRSEVNILEQRIAFRQEQIAAQSSELSQMSAMQLDFETLGLEIDEIEASLRSLRGQLLSFELGAQASSSQIQIVSLATVPVYPASPKVFVYTVGATIVGAVLVFLTVIMQELFGTRIRTSYDLEQQVENHALPTLHRSSAMGNRSLLRRLMNDRQLRRFKEAFGQKMSVGAGWRSNKIMVTGFVSGETLLEVRNLLGSAVRHSIVIDKNEGPFKVTSIGPVYSVKDWDALGEGQIVVVMEPNAQSAMDVQSLRQVGQAIPRKPLFVLWA